MADAMAKGDELGRAGRIDHPDVHTARALRHTPITGLFRGGRRQAGDGEASVAC